jgi:signal transduction histidine kinase
MWVHPARVWGVVLALIFTAEYAVMLVLPWLLPERPSWMVASALDALILTVVVAPVMWWTCVRPLQDVIRLRARFLAALFSHIEGERRRIAEELHDGVGQSLTLLVSRLRTASDSPDRPDLPQRLHELQDLAERALKDIRQIALGLRPSLLDDLGLAPAIERVAADVQQANGLQVAVDVAGVAGQRLPDAIETAVFRIFQEAINNVVKHSGATLASVQVRRQGGAVVLQVSDNGRGFDLAQVRAWTAGSGRLGLLGMRERATLLGGFVILDARPGGGTRITASIPIAVLADTPGKVTSHEPHSSDAGG